MTEDSGTDRAVYDGTGRSFKSYPMGLRFQVASH